MPKSKPRKDRKPFRGKFNGKYSGDPLYMFHQIASGTMGEYEEDAACQLLLVEMKNYEPMVMNVLITEAGLSGPPATNDDIRAIAKALTLEVPDATEQRSTGADQQDEQRQGGVRSGDGLSGE